MTGKLNEAEATLQNSLGIDPNGILTQFKLGVLYNTKGETSKAIQSFQKYLQVHPGYLEAYYHLATTHLKAKNKDSAKLVLEKALQVDPKNKKFKNLYDLVIAS